jgi:hypothetical protein
MDHVMMVMVAVMPPVVRSCKRRRGDDTQQHAKSGDKSESLHHERFFPFV